MKVFLLWFQDYDALTEENVDTLYDVYLSKEEAELYAIAVAHEKKTVTRIEESWRQLGKDDPIDFDKMFNEFLSVHKRIKGP